MITFTENEFNNEYYVSAQVEGAFFHIMTIPKSYAGMQQALDFATQLTFLAQDIECQLGPLDSFIQKAKDAQVMFGRPSEALAS